MRCACGPESRDEPATQQGSRSQTMQPELCPAARVSPLRASAFPREWKARSPTPTQIEEQLFKIHQATKGCRPPAALEGCREAGLGSSPSAEV